MVKTRMAPSPTGEFHIGSMRTLLYNYAYAKKNEGSLLLRIEDTDRERFVEGSVERMLDVIKYCNLSWDEGPEVGGPNSPYYQSQRLEIYQSYAKKLVEEGFAYYCFCTSERLEDMRKDQRAQGFAATRYDGTCLKLVQEEVNEKISSGMKYTIRLKVPKNEIITYKDLILGDIEFPSNDLDDQILIKSDGYPTYHLGVVVDDHLMGVTHILRGMEWLASTPKHILLYRMLNWEMPKTGHLPNLKEVGSNKKMSKRFGDVSVAEFLKAGYLPEALLNFIMLLGWNPGTEQEIYSIPEFVDAFSIEKIHSTDLVAFDREKLLWMNGHYIRNLSESALLDRMRIWRDKWDISDQKALALPDERLLKVLPLIKDRMKVFADFADLSSYFFEDPVVDRTDIQSFSSGRHVSIISSFLASFEGPLGIKWDAKSIETVCHQIQEREGYTPKEAFMTLRIVLTGHAATPPLFDVMEVLGKDVVISRLQKVMTY